MSIPADVPSCKIGVKELRKAFWDRAEKSACTIFRWVLRAKSQDMTEAVKTRPALILAPHADDETLGCGGIIALKRQAGTPVTVAIATDGSASHRHERWLTTTKKQLIALRELETRTACETLGMSPEGVRFLGFKDSELADQVAELSEVILTLIRQRQPREVYVCAEVDGHPDHVALAQAAHLAMQNLSDPSVDLFEYPVWSFDFRSWRHQGKTNTLGFLFGVRDMMRTAFSWRMRSVSIGPVLRIKTEALYAHRSQLGDYPQEPHWSGLPDAFLDHFLKNTETFRHVPPVQKGSE